MPYSCILKLLKITIKVLSDAAILTMKTFEGHQFSINFFFKKAKMTDDDDVVNDYPAIIIISSRIIHSIIILLFLLFFLLSSSSPPRLILGWMRRTRMKDLFTVAGFAQRQLRQLPLSAILSLHVVFLCRFLIIFASSSCFYYISSHSFCAIELSRPSMNNLRVIALFQCKGSISIAYFMTHLRGFKAPNKQMKNT